MILTISYISFFKSIKFSPLPTYLMKTNYFISLLNPLIFTSQVLITFSSFAFFLYLFMHGYLNCNVGDTCAEHGVLCIMLVGLYRKK